MGDREKLLALAGFIISGAGYFVFYAVRDGFIRRHTKIRALPEPLTGNRAIAIAIVWLIIAAVFLGTGLWLVGYALSLQPA